MKYILYPGININCHTKNYGYETMKVQIFAIITAISTKNCD